MTDSPIDPEPTWRDSRFHAIDDSVANLLWQLLLAVGAMFFAFTASRFVAAQLHISHGIWAFMAEGSLLTVFGCAAIYLTSAFPLNRAPDPDARQITAGQLAPEERSDLARALEVRDVELSRYDLPALQLRSIGSGPVAQALGDAVGHLRGAGLGVGQA